MNKPLVIITVYNRADETKQMLESYSATTDLSRVSTLIVDNASLDGARAVVDEWSENHASKGSVTVYHNIENIGCPRALNLVLKHHRKPDQAVIKFDNDILLTQRGWLDDLLAFVEDVDQGDAPDSTGRVAMVGAWYQGAVENNRLRSMSAWANGGMAYAVSPVIGHAVYHTSHFMDTVGYFDVLGPEHLYGFEDLILSHKADRLGLLCLVWDGWRITNIQRRNSLGSEQNRLVERLRPRYEDRVRALAHGGPTYTGEDGKPRPWPLKLRQ